MLPRRRPRAGLPATAASPASPPEAAPADRLDALEAMVGDLVAALAPAEEAPFGGRGRPRVLPALALWSGLVICVLRGFSSQRAVWRLLTGKALWHCPR